MVAALENQREAVADLCCTYRIARKHVFGSAIRDDSVGRLRSKKVWPGGRRGT